MTVKAKASKVRASEFRKPGKSYMSMEQLVLAHSAWISCVHTQHSIRQ